MCVEFHSHMAIIKSPAWLYNNSIKLHYNAITTDLRVQECGQLAAAAGSEGNSSEALERTLVGTKLRNDPNLGVLVVCDTIDYRDNVELRRATGALRPWMRQTRAQWRG